MPLTGLSNAKERPSRAPGWSRSPPHRRGGPA